MHPHTYGEGDKKELRSTDIVSRENRNRAKSACWRGVPRNTTMCAVDACVRRPRRPAFIEIMKRKHTNRFPIQIDMYSIFDSWEFPVKCAAIHHCGVKAFAPAETMNKSYRSMEYFPEVILPRNDSSCLDIAMTHPVIDRCVYRSISNGIGCARGGGVHTETWNAIANRCQALVTLLPDKRATTRDVQANAARGKLIKQHTHTHRLAGQKKSGRAKRARPKCQHTKWNYGHMNNVLSNNSKWSAFHCSLGLIVPRTLFVTSFYFPF